MFTYRAEKRVLASLPSLDQITRVAEDTTLGRNVLASKKISAGTLLGVYPGTKLTLRSYLNKHELLERAIRYSYRLSDDLIVDPTDIFGYLPNIPESRLALINEAPPEKSINIVSLLSSRNIWYLAIRDISKGESLFTFYGSVYARDYPSDFRNIYDGMEFSEFEVNTFRETAKRHRWLRRDIKCLLLGLELVRQQRVES